MGCFVYKVTVDSVSGGVLSCVGVYKDCVIYWVHRFDSNAKHIIPHHAKSLRTPLLLSSINLCTVRSLVDIDTAVLFIKSK